MGPPGLSVLGPWAVALDELDGSEAAPLPESISFLSGVCGTSGHVVQGREEPRFHTNTQGTPTVHTRLAACPWARVPLSHILWKLRMKLTLRPYLQAAAPPGGGRSGAAGAWCGVGEMVRVCQDLARCPGDRGVWGRTRGERHVQKHVDSFTPSSNLKARLEQTSPQCQASFPCLSSPGKESHDVACPPSSVLELVEKQGPRPHSPSLCVPGQAPTPSSLPLTHSLVHSTHEQALCWNRADRSLPSGPLQSEEAGQ